MSSYGGAIQPVPPDHTGAANHAPGTSDMLGALLGILGIGVLGGAASAYDSRLGLLVQGIEQIVGGGATVAASTAVEVGTEGAATGVVIPTAVGGAVSIITGIQDIMQFFGVGPQGVSTGQGPGNPAQNTGGGGGSAPTAAENAQAVWEYTVPGSGLLDTGQWLEVCFNQAVNLWKERYATTGNPWFVPLVQNINENVESFDPPLIDLSAISGYATPLLYLQAFPQGYTWGATVDGNYAITTSSGGVFGWRCTIDAVQWLMLQAKVSGSLADLITNGGLTLAGLDEAGGVALGASGAFRYNGPVHLLAGSTVRPEFNVADILSTDTLLTFLNRVNPLWTWAVDGSTGQVTGTSSGSGVPISVVCTLTPAGFEFVRYGFYLPTSGLPVRSLLGDLQMLFAMIPIAY